jgi:hypothetical protein
MKIRGATKKKKKKPTPGMEGDAQTRDIREDAPTNQVNGLSPETRVYGGLGHFSSAPGRSREA